MEAFEQAQNNPFHHSTELESYIPEAFKAPGEIKGVIIDEGLARDTPCRALNAEGSRQVFSQGIVGALSDKEQILYCKSGIDEIELSPEMAKRQKILREATTLCQKEVNHLSEGERLQPFLKCLSSQADRQGIKI